jgi:hypothetical protein
MHRIACFVFALGLAAPVAADPVRPDPVGDIDLRTQALMATHAIQPMVEGMFGWCSRTYPATAAKNAEVLSGWHARNDAYAALAPKVVDEVRRWAAANGQTADTDRFFSTDFPRHVEAASGLLAQRVQSDPAEQREARCVTMAQQIDTGFMDFKTTESPLVIAYLDGLAGR